MSTTLAAVPTPLDPDRADVVVLAAPGRPGKREHPALGPLPKAMDWLMDVRRLMRDGLSLHEADQIATEGFYTTHDGKGRKHQPSGQR